MGIVAIVVAIFVGLIVLTHRPGPPVPDPEKCDQITTACYAKPWPTPAEE